MKLSYKRNGLKNYMVVTNDKGGPESLREKMITRNTIRYLAKMTPQNIDGISYFYYDIQGRVNLEALFTGRSMTKAELSVILAGISGLLSELQRYLLTADEVLFSPENIWLLPDTLEPVFIYIPDMPEEEKHSIRSLAIFLTEHVDENDREAAILAYDYLVNVENGCFVPSVDYLGGDMHDTSLNDKGMEKTGYDRPSIAHAIAPEEYWEIKEGVSEEMKPFFDQMEPETGYNKKKVISFILLGLSIAAAAVYIISVINPSLFPIYLTDGEYMAAGAVIAIVFAIVLISVMIVCGKRTYEIKEEGRESGERKPAVFEDNEDELELQEYEERREKESDDEKTVLLRRNAFGTGNKSHPVLKYEDGRRIDITTFPFIIGKMKTRVDGVVEGAGISRIHAMIKKMDDRYYVSDLNSLNGTGINGKQLDTNETVEIKEGDILSLADTDLVFSIKAG